MSRRNKPRQGGTGARIAWPIVAAGVVLLAAAVFLLTRQGDPGGTPQLSVDIHSLDLGYSKFGTTRSFEIKVANVGDGELRFREKPYIEVLEGC